MIYIILSDVHGNIQAFEAIVRSFPETKDRLIVCAGDTVGYGANPNECVELMASLGAVNVMGNHDAAVIGVHDLSLFNFHAQKAALWTRNVIGERESAILRGLDFVKELEHVTLAHGTLHDPKEFIYMMTLLDARRTFELLRTGVCVVGHSHMPGAFMIKDGEIYESWKRKIKLEPNARYIINAGSVGQPRDGDNRACYCIYDTDAGEIEFRRVEYDIKSAHDAIMNAGLPGALAERLWAGT